MSTTTFLAKWGIGPTLAATIVGGVGVGATVSAFQFKAVGQAFGIVSKTAPMIGPAMKEGAAAVDAQQGAAGTAAAPPAGGAPASVRTG
jgi:hypothetical protein